MRKFIFEYTITKDDGIGFPPEFFTGEMSFLIDEDQLPLTFEQINEGLIPFLNQFSSEPETEIMTEEVLSLKIPTNFDEKCLINDGSTRAIVDRSN